MKLTVLLLTTLSTLALSSAQADTLTLPTTQRGWYRGDGVNDPSNLNYVTGVLGSSSNDPRYHSFFVFDLTQVTNQIVSAELQLFNPVFGLYTSDPYEILGIFDVTTPLASLTNGTGGVAAFNDLGSGVFYGAVTVDGSMNYGFTIPITLNSNALAALNAARGGRLAFGGALLTLDGYTDECVFSRSDGSCYTGLKLVTLPNSALPDLQVSQTDAPDPVSPGQSLTYHLSITNAGNLTASAVVLSDTLSTNATVSSVTVSQGSASHSANAVTCNLGDLAPGAVATVQVVVTPTSLGTVSSAAVVNESGTDANPADNAATQTTLVVPSGTALINIQDVALAEGDVGTTNALFQLTLSAPMGLPVSVAYATADGTAAQNVDYLPTNGLAVFPPGATNLTLAVAVVGDRNYEPDKSFQVNLSSPTNAVIGRASATGTILNDDPQPTVSIASVALPEGNDYTNLFNFSLTLSAPSYEPIWVDFYTADGTAVAGTDYIATNGGVFFPPGVTNRTIQVVVLSDITPEPDEFFHLYLPDAVNGTLLTNHVLGTILNDDGLPGVISQFVLSPVPTPQHTRGLFPLTVTATDAFGGTATNFNGGATLWASLADPPSLRFDFEEGDFSQWTPLNAGPTPGPYQIVPFDVAGHGCPSLAFRMLADWNAPDGVSRPVTLEKGVTYALTADIAALNDSGSWNLNAGAVGFQINSQVLTNFDFSSLGYIAPAQVFRTNLATTYTAPSNGTYQLTLRFTRGLPEQSVWNYADNVRLTPAVVPPRWIGPFTNGVWAGLLDPLLPATNVQLLAEAPEGYHGAGNAFDVLPTADLALSGTVAPAQVRAGSDVVFSFTITNQGPLGATNVVFTNILGSPLRFRSAALSQGSYTESNGVVVCSLGNLTNGQKSTVTITAKPYVPGPTTNWAVVASLAAFDPHPADNQLLTPLTADLPLLHVDNVSLLEGNTGTTNAQVALWLEGPVGIPISLDYATQDGTAQSGSDYLPVSGSLSFPADTTNLTVAVPILGDLTWEPTETLLLAVNNLVNAVANQPAATISIVNDDPLPALSIADLSLPEGNSGTTLALFPVTLSNPSSATIQVTCSTANGTAIAPGDYFTTVTTLTFLPGVTTQFFSVPIVGDLNNEPDQTFFVTLSSPVNASLARATATGTILNDDAAPGRLLRFTFDPIASPQTANVPIPVTIRAVDNWGQPASFSGTAVLTAQSDEFQVHLGQDDFEDGDLAGWTNYATPSLLFSNATDTAAEGTHSLKLTGKAATSTYYYSLRYGLTNCRPNHVRFSVRAGQTNALTGRLWLVGNPGYRACDFSLNQKGLMGLATNQNLTFVGTPYQSNRWYAVDLQLDWTAKRLSCLIDGALLVTNVPFLDSNITGADYVAVQNSDSGTSWFDNLQVLTTYPTNLVLTPAQASGFAGGVWTGTVTVQSPSPNVYLTVNDLAEHVGTSGLFDVLAPEVIRFLSLQRGVDGTVQMSFTGRVGQNYTLWTSSNLLDWVPALSLPCTNNPTTIWDINSPDAPRRFYRLGR